jgi:nucleoside-diphosphate-sugar epimerase
MSTALVTGGAGAIGSRLTSRLLEDGFEVVVVDDLSSGHRENVPESAEFVEADILDLERIGELIASRDFTHIFHLAALFANQNSVEHPGKDLDVNGRGMLQLLELSVPLTKRGVLRRFLYTSSSCVYGGAEGPVSEGRSFLLDTPYAITKLLGEHYATFFSSFHGVPISTVRLFNSYGPGEYPGRYRNVIPNFIAKALKGEPLTITGTGQETRDFTYVDDIVDGIYRAARSDAALGQTYNLATGRETAIKVLAELIVQVCESKSPIEYVPRRSWDHVLRRSGDIRKARMEIGYEPQTDLGTGLERTVRWIREHSPAS